MLAAFITSIGVALHSHAAETHEADVVVYGGTSAAVAAAVQVKRMGNSVIIVSPDIHLGGLSSGGLGFTDSGKKDVVGGIARSFYSALYQHYSKPEAWKWQHHSEFGDTAQGHRAFDSETQTMWTFEPHVAEALFERMVDENQIPVHRNRWLDRESGVELVGQRIRSIRCLNGETYRGKMFIDATYEGDLMAAAGVSYYVGREANSTYGENWNGVQVGVLHHQHHFGDLATPIDPYIVLGDPGSGVIAKISTEPPGKYGEADEKIQAYCFRLCMTQHPENRVGFSKPDGYDPADYELMARIYEAGWDNTFKKFDPIPNSKTDTNNHGPMSTDNIGMNYDYPEASYERRREIIAEHEQYQRGWLYFLCTDPRVPDDVQQEMNRWGLAEDEFVDNDHWPHQIYVREARRMIGPVVMNENHLLKRIPTPKPIGMGSYLIDSHNVQRYITPEGYVQNEGDIGVSTNGPYQISYDSITPQKHECENLLVPVCVSSSHTAFGSIRMEPVFMVLGQSAGTAVCLAIESDIAVQDLNYPDLRKQLLECGQVLDFPPTRAK